MLSNAYFLEKFRFDTAENEPAKNLQIFEKFSKKHFRKRLAAPDSAGEKSAALATTNASACTPPPRCSPPANPLLVKSANNARFLRAQFAFAEGVHFYNQAQNPRRSRGNRRQLHPFSQEYRNEKIESIQ